MDLTLKSAADLGEVARIVRKRQGLRIDSFADLAGLSKQFVADVERGKPTVQLGKVLHLLDQLGLRVKLDITQSDAAALAAAHAAQPLKRRRRTPPSSTDRKS